MHETLYYAAMLRLPRTWDKASKLARVDLVTESSLANPYFRQRVISESQTVYAS